MLLLKRFLLSTLFILIISVILFPQVTFACSCYPKSFSEKVQEYDKIFISNITEISKDPEDGHFEFITFNVLESIKGDAKDSFTIRSFSGFACNYKFKQNTKYLVFGSYNKKKEFKVSLCSDTKPISENEFEIVREILKVIKIIDGEN